MSEASAVQSRFDIQARWRPVIEMAGLDSPAHSPENTYRLAGALLHDSVVASMRMRRAFQIPDAENPTAFETDWQKLFATMGPVGRAGLKDRIQRAYGL